ncbi:rRNA processing protein, putative [Trypanosoma brucei gambiense DAL972]|uniref:rRNA processing protein, putative n=2 Tax=Trypanosoma brucei TaxID=5691 RepID=C9ZZK7_TRYB9|nr:rRNA processing protein, putative [Trypanosoma brucei gambiense DAL972]RHW66952.1 rRNA processing protein [Trypanosoma brucei equiperdum]CBH14856.1 rRNA processing protein, putative [Trypanosoma brucei gambiense DAL972]|eukprot:XP_011777122.1 rRNA processing protein, putative [Trypanosoma brucei gambiense DAL972]
MPVYDVAVSKSKKRKLSTDGVDPPPVRGEERRRVEKQVETAPGDNREGNGNAERLTTVEFSEPAQWVERMALTSTKPLPSDLNADDDPKREEAFIQQALLSVVRGISLLEAGDVPWKRPDDYYAEMFKDDVQMSRIASAMEKSKARIEERAHRRAMKDQKKYGKEVQAEVLRQRAKYKRDMGARISEWRRKRKGNEDLDDILNADETTSGSKGRGAARGVRGGGTTRAPRQKNLRPGGVKRRPGKNARRRR